MSKVLYIKANARPEGVSRTYEISEEFVKAYKEHHPEDEIETLDLYNEDIKFLAPEDLSEVLNPNGEESQNHPILKYATKFKDADKYIIAEPLWNLSIPAILKAYIDYICVNGITFKYTAQGAEGLCQGKKAVNIVARGGEYSHGPMKDYEMGDRYLRTIFGFLGITDFTTITAEKLDVMGEDTNAIIDAALRDAHEKAMLF